MASIVYPLILFLFIFGAGVTFLNESGMYATKLPTAGLSASNSTAYEYNEAMVSASSDGNAFNMQGLFLIGKVVAGGILAIFSIGGLLYSMGVPVPLVGFLISPIGIIVVFWVVSMWLGREPE